MRKYLHWVIITCLSVFLIFGYFVKSTFAAQDNSQPQKVVTINEDEIVNKDFYLAGADIVEIAGTVNGDVIVAGGQVTISGKVNGDILAAGGALNISGDVSQDVRVAGGQITISGNVGRNLTIAGGNIEVTDSANIKGGALIAGGNVVLSAPVAGEVKCAVGNLTVSNYIGKDLVAYAGTIRLASTTDVNGNFVYYSDNDASISESAKIKGETTHNLPPVETKQIKFPPVKNIGVDLVKIKIQLRILSFISALIVGLLMVRLLPNYTKAASSNVRENFWRSLVIGFVTLVATPIIAAILMFTLVGLPLGMIILFTYFIYMYLAKLYVSYQIGVSILKDNKALAKPYVPFALGLLVYYVVSFIPFVGGLVEFVVLLLGLGAAVLTCRQFYEKSLKAKLI